MPTVVSMLVFFDGAFAMRSHLVGVSSLIAQGFDFFRTVSESSRTRKWYETFNAAMKEEVETDFLFASA